MESLDYISLLRLEKLKQPIMAASSVVTNSMMFHRQLLVYLCTIQCAHAFHIVLYVHVYIHIHVAYRVTLLYS